ncbi:MAG: PadR family transcriptional regulator [Halobacteriaceae archaeon]
MSEAQTASSAEVRGLTAFQQNILAVLSSEPMYGLAIKRELEDYYDEEVNHGRLYPNLDDLVSMDLVEKSELDKRTNEYALTEAGLDAVVDRLSWTLSKFVTDDERAAQVRSLVERVE